MVARDIMHPDPETVDESKTVREVIELLSMLGVRHLPVTRGEQLVGIISDRDVRQLTVPVSWNQNVIADESAEILNEPVTALMSGGTLSVAPEASLAELVDVICDHNVGAVPVVDDRQRVVGIVSYVDLLRALRP